MVITSGEPVPVLVCRSNRFFGYGGARRSRIAYVAISSFSVNRLSLRTQTMTGTRGSKGTAGHSLRSDLR